MTSRTRIERDPLGEKAVPSGALYGIQTLRAAENFPISGLRPLAPFGEGFETRAFRGPHGGAKSTVAFKQGVHSLVRLRGGFVARSDYL